VSNQTCVSTEFRVWATERISKHNQILIEGNGKEPMTVRVDRLEQSMSSARRFAATTCAMLATAIITTTVDIIIRAHR